MIFLLMPYAYFLHLWSYDVMGSGAAELPCSALGRCTVMGSKFYHSMFICHEVWGGVSVAKHIHGTSSPNRSVIELPSPTEPTPDLHLLWDLYLLWSPHLPDSELSSALLETRSTQRGEGTQQRTCLLAMQHWEEKVIKPSCCGRRTKTQ